MADNAPPLLLDRSPALQIVLVIVGPVAFGVLTGVLLVNSATGYLITSLLGVLGGLAAGYEHPDAGEGARRGFCGGLLFGTTILCTGALAGGTAKADLPDPQWVLVVVTTVLGIAFGAIGGSARARREQAAS